MAKGIEISQTAIPVSSAADYQKSLDSRWKILEILDEIVFTFTFTTTSWVTGVNYVKIYSHSKNKILPFEVQDLGSDYDTLHVPNIFATDDGIYAVIIHAAADATTAITLKLFVRIYNLDVTATYQAPSSTPSPGSGNEKALFGAEIVSNDFVGARMGDEDMTHFSLNTGAKPFQIHMHGTQNVNNDASHRLIVDHYLGYLPTFLLAGTTDQGAKYNGGVYDNPGAYAGKRTMQPLGSLAGLASSTFTTLTMRGAQSALFGNIVYLILKDPVALGK